MINNIACLADELRRSCRGEGLTIQWVETNPNDLASLLGVRPREVVPRVKFALEKIPRTKEVDAFEVALGFGGVEGHTLGRRRLRYLESNSDANISLVTLRRREIIGAEFLAKYLLAAEADYADEKNEQGMADLKIQLVGLVEQLKEIISKL